MDREPRGYVIVATNTDDVDYIDCAIACAKSIKMHTPEAKIALLSDFVHYDFRMFDHIIKFPYPINNENPYANDWQIFEASPFRQTIKIEADMIIPHSIDHWWTMLEHKDVVLTTNARNYHNEITTDRSYRKIFDENNLPDVYNAITYWRYSELASEFFNTVRELFENWDDVRKTLKLGLSDPGTTDVVYAVAAKIHGVENVTLPGTSYPTLIHMKSKINQCLGEDWTKELIWELDGSNIRINTIDQQYPFHYHIKEFSKVLNEQLR